MLVLGKSKRFGFEFYYDSADRFVGEQIAADAYEPYESELFLSRLNADSVLIDVGANIGYYTMLAASKIRSGKIYAFEPNRRNFHILQMNMILNDIRNVELFQMAVSDTTGTAQLYLSEDNFGDHQLYQTTGRASTIVETITLDQFASSRNIRPDVLKIDTQGFDYNVLNGGTNLITSLEFLELFAEFWNYGNLNAGIAPDKYFGFLTNHFSNVQLIDETRRTTLNASLQSILSECSGLSGYTHANLLCNL